MKKTRILSLLIVVILLLGAFTVGAAAAETADVYVATTGLDTNVGTAEAPVLSLNKALELVENGGVIHIVDSYTATAGFVWENHDKDVTITGGTLDLSQGYTENTDGSATLLCYVQGDAVTFDNVNLVLADNSYYFANGNRLQINENVTITGEETVLFGGGYKNTVSGVDVKLLGGDYFKVYGGSYKSGVDGDVNLYVGNVNADYTTSHDGKTRLYGACSSGNITGDVNLTLAGANLDYVSGVSHTTTCGVSGKVNVLMSGGSLYSLYAGGTNAQPGGGIYMTISGGTVAQVFGTGRGVNYEGDISIHLKGGTITRRFFGGCYNDTDKDDAFYVNGNIDVFLYEGMNLSWGGRLTDDLGFYAHSRLNPLSDEENTHLYYMGAAAQIKHADSVGSQNYLMSSVMDSTTVADTVSVFDMTSKAQKWNVLLGNDISANFYLNVPDAIAEMSVLKVTFDGNTESYDLSQCEPFEEGLYLFSVDVAAAQMTEEITLQLVVDGVECTAASYTVAQYANAILSGGYGDEVNTLVKHMLNYGAAAQVYFGINPDNKANAGHELSYTAQLPAQYPELTVNGELSGVQLYGATLVLRNHVAVRYYFTADSVEGVTFTANGVKYSAKAKNGMFYVEIPGINPQAYSKSIVLSAVKGQESLEVTYSPLTYIVRMSKTGSDTLKALLGAMYGYHEAAVAYLNNTILLPADETIKVDQDLIGFISVKPSEYTEGLVIAENTGNLSAEAFAEAMKLIKVVPNGSELWLVKADGTLTKATAAIDDTLYETLEEAVAAANATAKADTITVLTDVTVGQLQITEDVTVVSNDAVTITGTASVFRVAAGKSLTVNGTESAPITIVGDTADVIVSYGVLHLRYVNISGGSKGINIQDGGYLEASHIQVSGTAGQGVYLTGADATGSVSDFVLSETSSAAVRPMKGAKITLTDGTIYADTYGVAVDGSSEAVLTNVTVERTGKKTDALVNIDGTAKLEINGTTKIDSKGFAGHGVNVAASTATFIVNGGEITGNNAEGYADVVLVKGATIHVKQALTASAVVKAAEYTDGLAIAVKAGEISNADFASAMEQLVLTDTNWLVDETGCLSKKPCEHAWTEEITTQPSCTEAGVKTYTCSVCGDSYTEAIDPVEHTVEYVEAVEPTYEAAGNIEYWYCTVCNTVWADEARTEVISADAVVLPKLERIVASVNGVNYTSLEAAVAAANEAQETVIITILESVTVESQIEITNDVTIVSNEALTITGTASVFKIAADKTVAITGTDTAQIAIVGVNTADVIYNEGNLNLSYVNISGGKYAVNTRAGSTVTMANVSINSTANHSINIAGGAAVTLSDVSVANAGKRGISCGGTVEVSGNVLIDGTAGYGIYLTEAAKLTGSGLTVQNVNNSAADKTDGVGIFSEGAEVNVSNLNVKNTAQQGVQFKKGSVTLSNFTISQSGSAAVRIMNGTVTLTDGTIYAYNYGIAADGSSETTVTDVTIERAAKDDAYTTNPLVNIDSNAKLEILGTTKIDGKNLEGDGVNVAAFTVTFILGGGTITGNTTDVVLVENATIQLQQALTVELSVESGAYTEGLAIAVKAGEISDEDFTGSMEKLILTNAAWVVDSTGCLSKKPCEHAWTEEITTQPSCTEAGVKTYTCSVCGDSYTEAIDLVEHTVEYVEAVEPTYEAAGNIEYWYCTVCNTVWADEARTEVISADAVVLPKLESIVASVNGVDYTSLETAVAAANEAEEAATITILEDVTVSSQLVITNDVTIVSSKALTITADDAITTHLFSVTSGKLTVTGASEDAKITIQSGKATLALVHTNGGDAELTNVDLIGNSASTAGSNAGRGIYNEAGTVTAKSVNIQNMVKGDGIYVKAGATLNLDNVKIVNANRYSIKTYGTVNIYNTVHADHALTIENSNDHAIDIDAAGSVNSYLNDVPENTYAIRIDTTRKSSARGIIVRGNGSMQLTNISIQNTKMQGVLFNGTSSKPAAGTISDFAISGTGAAVELVYSTVTLTNGTVNITVVKDDNSTLTENNVTVVA